MTALPDATPEPPLPSEEELIEIEAHALELARLAGAEIVSTLEREITVEYKDQAKPGFAPTNPVSEVDHAVEDLVRARLAERFPAHALVAEELESHPLSDAGYVWAVDPVDGTTNFVNGFPLFAASIGVLHYGRPVVGAIWCSTGHELRPGVYHAHHGGALTFEGHAVPPRRPSSGVARRLSAAPGGAPNRSRNWDTRTTGSAAIECAFVAAGIFASATFWSPSIWDIAAGVTLVRAAGNEALVRGPDGWQPLERFEAPARVKEDRAPSVRDWRLPLLLGTPEALAELRQSMRKPPLRSRLTAATRRMLHR